MTAENNRNVNTWDKAYARYTLLVGKYKHCCINIGLLTGREIRNVKYSEI